MRVARDPLRVSMVVLILISVARIHQHVPGLIQLRPALVATALVAGYAFLKPSLLARGSLFRTWPAKLILAFFVLACLSVPFGISMGNSGKYILEVYFKTVIFAFLIVACVRNVRDFYTMTWSLVICGGILAYLALFVFQLRNYDAYARLDGLYMYDANDVGCVLVTAIGCAVLHMKTSRPMGRWISFFILVLMCAAIARTGSRGAMVGLVAVGAALLILAQGASILERLAIMIVAVVGLSVWAPRGYWDQMATILRPTEDYNYTSETGRKKIAERGMRYMREYPVFGLGINNFSKAECQISELARNYVPGTPIRCAPPHNSFVEAGAELGVPGLIAYTVFIFGGMFAPILVRRRMPKHWKKGDAEERFLYQATVFLPVCFAGFGATSFFLTFAFSDLTYMLLALLACLYVAVDYKKGQNLLFPPPVSQGSSRAPERRSRRPLPAPTLPAASEGSPAPVTV